MTTAATIRTNWNTLVFADASVQAYSANAIDTEWRELSRADLRGMFEGQEINFFNYIVSRSAVQNQISGGTTVEYSYRVEVNYYLEAKADKNNYKVAIDAFEAVTDRVITGLTNDWNSTVSYSRLPDSPPVPQQLEILQRTCWRATQVYTAFLHTTI